LWAPKLRSYVEAGRPHDLASHLYLARVLHRPLDGDGLSDRNGRVPDRTPRHLTGCAQGRDLHATRQKAVPSPILKLAIGRAAVFAQCFAKLLRRNPTVRYRLAHRGHCETPIPAETHERWSGSQRGARTWPDIGTTSESINAVSNAVLPAA